jgi:predicted XRE-type DNA-binding protein
MGGGGCFSGLGKPVGINDRLRGRIARFSLDAWVNIATALGRKGTVKRKGAA